MPSYGGSRLFPLPLLSAISNFSRREREREKKSKGSSTDRRRGWFLPPKGEIKRERGRGSGDKREGTGLCGGRTVAS